MDEVAELLGVVSLIAMAVVIATGVLIKRKPKLLRKVHKVVGYGTLVLAVFHGLIMMLD